MALMLKYLPGRRWNGNFRYGHSMSENVMYIYSERQQYCTAYLRSQKLYVLMCALEVYAF